MLLSDDRPAPLPMIVQSQIVEIKCEEIGSGLNSQIYFVCNQIGEDWIELPSVTPQQIIVSRQIKKYLTGNLNNQIISVPSFPGREKNYLRSLIARITSGTFVSPINYYKFESVNGTEENSENVTDEDEESNEEEDEEIEIVPKDLNNVRKNSTYNSVSSKDLLNMESWVHNKPYILKQGRATVYTPDEHFDVKSLKEENGEEEETKSNSSSADEIRQNSLQSKTDSEIKTPEIEVGPPLLASCSNDQSFDNIPPWTTRFTSIGNNKDGMVLLRSNLWPGSFTIASGKVMSNIYIGWGHKFSSTDYSPPSLPSIQNEFSDPELKELQDPTVEQEEELRMMKEMKRMELEDEHDFIDSEDGENENEEEGNI